MVVSTRAHHPRDLSFLRYGYGSRTRAIRPPPHEVVAVEVAADVEGRKSAVCEGHEGLHDFLGHVREVELEGSPICSHYGLRQVFANEPWHYELRPELVRDGCPAMYADAAEKDHG